MLVCSFGRRALSYRPTRKCCSCKWCYCDSNISKKFEPQGVTVLCLLSESHISIHTWPEEGKAAVDVYTCGDCNPKIGCDIIIQQLYAQDHTLSYIER